MALTTRCDINYNPVTINRHNSEKNKSLNKHSDRRDRYNSIASTYVTTQRQRLTDITPLSINRNNSIPLTTVNLHNPKNQPDSYLEHDDADMVNALRDGLSGAADGDGAFRRIGQHFGGDLYGRAGHLADLLDLRAALADERAALTGGHDKAERDGRPRYAAAAAVDFLELGTPLWEPKRKSNTTLITKTH